MELTVSGKNADMIMQRLRAWSLTDSSGYEADSVKLVIDSQDVDGLPDDGEVYAVSLGQVNRGDFQISKRQLSINPLTLTLILTPKPFNITDVTGYREKSSQSWENQTIATIVNDVIAKHGFDVYVHNAVSGITLDHIARTNETAHSFIQRLARQFDCFAKIVDSRRYVFAPRGKTADAIGQPIETLTIDSPDDVSNFSAEFAGSISHNGVKARYQTETMDKPELISLGSAPFKFLTDKFVDKAQAEREASAAMVKLKREGTEINLTLPINASAAAEGLMVLGEGFPAIARGTYSIDRVVFNDRQQMSITASLPSD